MAEQEKDFEQAVPQVTKVGGWNSEEERLQYYRARTRQAQELRKIRRMIPWDKKFETVEELVEMLKAEGHYDKLSDKSKAFWESVVNG